MLSEKHESVLRILYNLFINEDMTWALTGSTAFCIQGMLLVPDDIDIQTDHAGAYRINELLKPYVKQPVSFSTSTSKHIRSHFGRFEIDGVLVEVMGDIQKKLYNGWEKVTDLKPIIHFINYKGMKLPVLSLSYESAAYRKMGRVERAEEIDRFIYKTSTSADRQEASNDFTV
ncbi:MAG: hypothetical protein LBS19_10840 [Clostridiales bacterium]|jgi:hypothetical protein|nr:hypothetical protein [Clostridiales bacterium]